MLKKSNTVKLFVQIAKASLTPPPDLTVSEWADKYRKLSSEASAEPGQWRTDRAPYQRKIMNCINDATVEKIIVMASAQVGKSEILLNCLGYHIDFSPAPIMFLQPTESLAKNFSKERIAPMIRDCPTLVEKVADVKSRDSGNTVLQKSFFGGYVALVGVNAPGKLASRPIKILLADEVDRFPISSGVEGDPLSLAEKRTTTFSDRKKIFVSTPTIKGESRIESEYLLSTQEIWNLPCPSCEELQPLSFDQINLETAEMACKHCGCLHNQYEWKNQPGEWVADNPSSAIKGFHLNELLSPWKTWEEIIIDYHEAKKKGPEAEKVFTNTSLGETWEPKGTGMESDDLFLRREDYGAEVPNEALVLTMGVDVQADRLEYEIVGWGIGKVSYGIQYGVLMGDPGMKLVWEDLDKVIGAKYTRKDGVELRISTTCVDIGGNNTTEVYSYCKRNESLRVWPVKGRGGKGIPFVKRPTTRNAAKVYLFILGVDSGKDTMMSMLAATIEQDGYCHFPTEESKGYTKEYFKGLTSEHRVPHLVSGQVVYKWEKKTKYARNEPWDLRNYAHAAFEIFNPNMNALKEYFEKDNSKSEPIVRPSRPRRERRVVSAGIS